MRTTGSTPSDDDRLAACTRRAAELGIDHLVLTPGEDLLYLTGARLESHERLTALVVDVTDPGRTTLVLPALELTVAARVAADQVGARIVPWADGLDPVALVADVLAAAPERGTIAISDSCPARHLLPLQQLSGASLVPAGEVLDPVRAVKSPAEIAELARAGAAIDSVHRRMAELLVVGRTEREVAALIREAIVEAGLTHAEFVIVGSGPHGADPHHEVSDRVVTVGDVVVVDIGGPVPSGYHSDCTRTYAMGPPDPEVARAYEALELAQARARAAVRPGVPIGRIDAVARESLTAAGLGEYFTHRTGHGIGLGLHEAPFAAPGATTVLRPGMCFSIEPGIYLPGRWGARLEDIVVVTEDGVRALDTAPRGLTELPG